MARSSGQREQLTEEGKQAGRSLIKREKSTGPKTDSCEAPRQTQKNQLL